MNPTVKLIFELLVILELVLMEQIFIFRALKGKYKLLPLILSNIGITIAIVLITIFVLSKQDGYGDGGGRNLLLGILYIIPPIAFAKCPLKGRLIVTFLGFSYGLLVYALSIRIGYFFDTTYLAVIVFIIQTVLHGVIILVYHLLKIRLNLAKLFDFSPKLQTRLLIVVFLSFFLIVSFNSNLTRDTTDLNKLLSVLLLAAFILFSFVLIYELWKTTGQNESLTNQIQIDRLTNLRNRTSYKEHIYELLNKKTKFSVIYIDLDMFKSINDNYGHSIGDQYLVDFASLLSKYEDEEQKFYRMSGDEFCCLTTNLKKTKETLTTINKTESILNNIKFLGFSYGIANYPDDALDEMQLLQHADMNMYRNKKNYNKDKQ